MTNPYELDEEKGKRIHTGVNFSNSHVKCRMNVWGRSSEIEDNKNPSRQVMYICPTCRKKLRGTPGSVPKCNGRKQGVSL